MKSKPILIGLTALILLTSSSCVTTNSRLKREYIKKTDAEEQVEKLKKQNAEDIAKREKEINDTKNQLLEKKDEVIGTQDAQLQEAANSLYGADTAFKFYTEPGRIDLIINNRVNEASAATGKKATAEAMEKENKRLSDELDETKTSLEKLRKDHDAKIAENTKLAEDTELKKKEVDGLKDQINKLTIAHADALKKMQDALDAANQELNNKKDAILALEKKRADDAVWIRKVKMKVMGVLGLIAIGCAIGAIWSPAFKTKFATAAIIAGIAAAGVMYVQPWMVATVVGLAILCVAIKIVMEHRAADKTAENLINYVEDLKTSNPAAYDKKKLIEYNGRYELDPSTGQTVVVRDPDVEKFIEEKLKKSQKL